MDSGPRKPAGIDQYIAAFPEAVREKLGAMRAAIRETAPAAVEKISYGMPTFHYKGNLVHFAAFAKHIGFYPTPSGIDAFRAELSGYETSKGAIRFPLDQPLPLELVKRIVAFRVAEAERGKRG